MSEKAKDFSALYLPRPGKVLERFWTKEQTLIIFEKLTYVRCLIISPCQRKADCVCALRVYKASTLLGAQSYFGLEEKTQFCIISLYLSTFLFFF